VVGTAQANRVSVLAVLRAVLLASQPELP
jgi:hypothetical protein